MMKISFKILEVNFGNSILDNSKWDSRSDYIAKKNQYLEQSETLLERGNRKPNPLIQTVVHRPNLYFSKIHPPHPPQKKKISSGTGKKCDLPDT